jgi:putative lipoic acid-binding regulatory protein
MAIWKFHKAIDYIGKNPYFDGPDARKTIIPAMNTPAAPLDDPRKDSLIEYPSKFPIKVMGANADGFVHAITRIAERFDPEFDASTVELRPSKAGNYLGVTITITATSREQLDDLYRALSGHPMVKVVL